MKSTLFIVLFIIILAHYFVYLIGYSSGKIKQTIKSKNYYLNLECPTDCQIDGALYVIDQYDTLIVECEGNIVLYYDY